MNTYVVSKQIRQSGLTVALSGVGGDELFAGYPFFSKYFQLKQKENWWKLSNRFAGWEQDCWCKWQCAKGQDQATLANRRSSIDECYPVFRQVISPRIISKLTTHPFHKNDLVTDQLHKQQVAINKFPFLSQVSIAEYLGYTQHTLLKDTDQMSMAVALEVREPYFDHELVEFVLNIPDKWKYSTYPKSLLVESLGNLLPGEIVHRRKQGFLFPWSVWMKRELKNFCEDRLERISQRSFIRGEALMLRWQRF